MSSFKPGQTVIALESIEGAITKGWKYELRGTHTDMYILNDQTAQNYFQNWGESFAVVCVPNTDDAGEQLLSDGGGGQNYYDLPVDADQLQDLIEYRNMNGNIKDIFKSCYRAGLKEGTSEEYDARKRAYYSLRELGRILRRKDYITIAKELIAHQSVGDE